MTRRPDDSSSARIPLREPERSGEDTKPVDLQLLDLPPSDHEAEEYLRELALPRSRLAFKAGAAGTLPCAALSLLLAPDRLPLHLAVLGVVLGGSLFLLVRPDRRRIGSILAVYGALVSSSLGILAAGHPAGPWLGLELLVFGIGATSFVLPTRRLVVAALAGGALYLGHAAALADPGALDLRELAAALIGLGLGGGAAIAVNGLSRRQARAEFMSRTRLDRARDKLTARNRDLKARVQAEVTRSLGTLELTRYVPREVAERLLRGAAPELRRERRRLTVCAVKIGEFSAIADALLPEDTGRLLARYMEEMCQAVDNYGGAIDRVGGDGMTILFGAPEPRQDVEGAEACLEMSLEMQARASRLVRTCEQLGTEVPFAIQIGVATGYCTVGTFGSLERMQYTAIGGTVELAWHLCELAAPGQILVAHAASGLVREKVELVSLGELTPPGHARPVHAYRVAGLRGVPQVNLVGA